MTPLRTAIGTTVLSLGVVAIVLVAVVGVLFVSNQFGERPTTTSTSSALSTMCEVPVEGAGVFLHVVSDSTQKPLAGILVYAVPTANSCYGAGRPGPGSYTTNATGWVSLNVTNLQANYFFETSLMYAGQNYSFVLPQGPLDTTNATFRLPSGNLSISLCYTMTTHSPCSPYTASTTGTSLQGTATTTTVMGGIAVVSARPRRGTMVTQGNQALN